MQEATLEGLLCLTFDEIKTIEQFNKEYERVNETYLMLENDLAT